MGRGPAVFPLYGLQYGCSPFVKGGCCRAGTGLCFSASDAVSSMPPLQPHLLARKSLPAMAGHHAAVVWEIVGLTAGLSRPFTTLGNEACCKTFRRSKGKSPAFRFNRMELPIGIVLGVVLDVATLILLDNHLLPAAIVVVGLIWGTGRGLDQLHLWVCSPCQKYAPFESSSGWMAQWGLRSSCT